MEACGAPRTLGRGIIAAALAVAFAASGPLPPAHAADPFDIDVIIPLSGGSALLGKQEQTSTIALEKVINREGGIHGQPVHFVFGDDQSSPQIGVQLATAALARHPTVIFGSTISGICNAMAPLMRSGPVLWCYSPSIRPEPGGYEFTSQIASRDQQKALMTYFRDKGWKKVALITTTDASGQDAERAVIDLLKEPDFTDMKLVDNEHFNPADVTISAQIENIRAAGPQVIVTWATTAAGGTVFRGLIQAGIADLPVAASGSNMTVSMMLQFAATVPKQLFFGAGEWAANGDPRIGLPPAVLAEQKLFDTTAKEAGFDIDSGTELGWGPIRVVIAALNKLPPQATAQQLHDFLVKWQGYAGVDGIYDFDKVPQRGLDLSNAVVVRWDPGAKGWHLVSKPSGIPIE